MIVREKTNLGTEARRNYERDGYMVLDSTGVEPALLDGIVGELEGLYEGAGQARDGVFYSWHRIMDAWRINESVRALALAPKMLTVLRELYGREPLAFQTLNFRKGTEQAVHSDAIHFNSMPAGYMCGVWVALEDIDMDNGPLIYYPGTHRRPEVHLQDVGPDADEEQYVRFLGEMVERESLEPAYGTIRKGQALVWASNILHGGSPQRDRARTRHSQVTHFFFEGCRYWTPLLSTESEIHWRNPEWITEDPDRERSERTQRIREAIRSSVPAGGTALVASYGDHELVSLGDREGWHFPRADDGSWLGHNPADSQEAVAHVQKLKQEGAEYLVFPDESLWWLDHYGGLAEHLETHGRRLRRDAACAIYRL
jgi:hypothetical protein